MMRNLVIAGEINQPISNLELFRKFFFCTEYDTNVGFENFQTSIERLKEAEVALINVFTPINDEVLKNCPKLKSIISCSAGIDHVDLQSAARRNVAVRWYKSYCARTLAEKSLAMLLIAFNKIIPAIDDAKSGKWSHLKFQGREINGRTILILGRGESGKILGSFLVALGANVVFTNSKTSKKEAIKFAENADAISVHMALNDQTKNYIDAHFLRVLKKDVVIVNFARGGLIDSDALADFLELNPEASSCLDVLDTEPPSLKDRLLRLPNSIITPHIGWNSFESNIFLIQSVFDDVMQLK